MIVQPPNENKLKMALLCWWHGTEVALALLTRCPGSNLGTNLLNDKEEIKSI